MTLKKQEITVIGSDKDIIFLLEFRYMVKEILSVESYMERLVNMLEGEEESGKIADFIVIGNDMDIESFEVNKQPKNELYNALSTIFSIHREMYFTPPTIIGFGKGAIALSKLNSAEILYNVTNHSGVKHSTSFVMSDNKVLEFDVNSNHKHMIVPSKNKDFSILAFSTYNNSNSYTKFNGETFKACRNFIEIEGVKFNSTNCYCFLYDTPKEGESVLIDLTLELLNK
jgi:tRNA(Phe) wybutosine-synthesizing methylase Tyw3